MADPTIVTAAAGAAWIIPTVASLGGAVIAYLVRRAVSENDDHLRSIAKSIEMFSMKMDLMHAQVSAHGKDLASQDNAIVELKRRAKTLDDQILDLYKHGCGVHQRPG